MLCRGFREYIRRAKIESGQLEKRLIRRITREQISVAGLPLLPLIEMFFCFVVCRTGLSPTPCFHSSIIGGRKNRFPFCPLLGQVCVAGQKSAYRHRKSSSSSMNYLRESKLKILVPDEDSTRVCLSSLRGRGRGCYFSRIKLDVTRVLGSGCGLQEEVVLFTGCNLGKGWVTYSVILRAEWTVRCSYQSG